MIGKSIIVTNEWGKISYQVLKNGMYYHATTPDVVVHKLENARTFHDRVRLFYGNTEGILIGKDWGEENDTIGYVGSSTGSVKIPLLLKTNHSQGGGAILDHCIVKLINMKSRLIEYQHPYYITNSYCINGKKVLCNGELEATFKTERAAYDYVAFMRGERHIRPRSE